MPVRRPEEPSLTPARLVGRNPIDAGIIADFFRRYDEALWELASNWRLPADLWTPAPVLPGHVRVTDQIYEGSPAHPKFLVDGAFLDLKWKALLSLMYPGGDFRSVVSYEGVQGHPDYLCQDGETLIEIKTVGRERWLQAKRAPLPPNREQILTYMMMAGRRIGLLVYEARDELELWLHLLRIEIA